MTDTISPARRALVVGATGIAGQSVSRQLVALGFTTYGLSRGGDSLTPGVTPVAANLLDPASLASAVEGLAPELVFITAWMKKDTEAENIEVNSATVRNILTALEPQKSVRHVALVTGLKHYLGPFDNYATGVMADTPFNEDEPRLTSPNFYYNQEDEVFKAAERAGFTWSVHRAHTVFGYAVGNAMNMVLTLSVYATLCRELGLPFTFPGSATQWNGITDVTDAELLAEQLIWASTDPAGENEAFNIANGDVFRWRWMWPRVAGLFGVEPVGFDEEPRPLDGRMAGMEEAWSQIAARHGLAEPDIHRLASWWHTDSDLGRNIEAFTNMNKSRDAGFMNYRTSFASFADKVARYREARIIP
ncbi:SDR family oxidoreductase [Subtercola boreus]|uniref:NAD-dependent dehydratase n=1 Tax=Subtercola boreus TaxID=120213 RepID=A0A3E0W7T3_9MICO|nr:SDR family oxidoreductase [Subtercola boreus]RFA18080.1 NAD-dependent dehydratase [Subtercola boreus]RFA18462.1 NAD-dependent dehydratase [Subtercola boreus]RFA24991.1 NAD-dependent dehydratase [Subtercola boreus]